MHMTEEFYNFRRIESEDMKAFEGLFMDLYSSLCSVADHYLGDEASSKDIAQEAFIKLWDKREEFHSIISVKSYLYATVRNLSLNYIRDNRKNCKIRGVLPEIDDSDFKSVIIEEETIRALYAAIDKLPAQTSRIVQMSLKGIKNQEIAEKLGISVNSVKTLKYNAFHTLRKELGEELVWSLLLLLEFSA